MKEKNNQELVHILRVYLGRVITLAFVNTDTYQLLMLCADYQAIMDLMFHFCLDSHGQVSQLENSESPQTQRPMENWLTKCLNAKITTDKASEKTDRSRGDDIIKLEMNEHQRNRV